MDTKGLLPTPRDVAQAALDYAVFFLRIQVDWLVALGIVKYASADDRGESPEGPPPTE